MRVEIERDHFCGDFLVTIEQERGRHTHATALRFTPDEFKAFAEQISGELFDLTA